MGDASSALTTASIAKIMWVVFHAFRYTSTTTEPAKSAWINAAAATLPISAFNVTIITYSPLAPPHAHKAYVKLECYATTWAQIVIVNALKVSWDAWNARAIFVRNVKEDITSRTSYVQNAIQTVQAVLAQRLTAQPALMVTTSINHTGHQAISVINATMDAKHARAIPPVFLAGTDITMMAIGAVCAQTTVENAPAILIAQTALNPTPC
jgi:hypothetical protein